MFSYNTSVHEGTKCTPYKLVFGELGKVVFLEKGNIKISYKGKPTVVHIHRKKQEHEMLTKI